MSVNKFKIRPAGLSDIDADFIVACFDAAITHTNSTGNGDQWGSQPFSAKEGFRESVEQDVAQSLDYTKNGKGEAKGHYIAEIEDPVPPSTNDGLHRRQDEDGRTWLLCAFADIWEDQLTKYLLDNPTLSEHVEAAKSLDGGYIFLHVLISDFRAIPKSKGAGAALLEDLEYHGRQRGKKALYVDAWVGGNMRLVEYYEKLGFDTLQDFRLPRTSTGGFWNGRLFKKDL